MPDLLKQRREIRKEITKRHYQSLRCSVLGEDTPNEWEVRIDYDKKLEKYFVYNTMDRTSVRGKREYSEFNDAKERFLELLDLTVKVNRRQVSRGEFPEYRSPLWDQPVLDVQAIDAMDIVDGHLELLLSDPNVWLADTEQDHLLELQEKINNYIRFLESKQYVPRYGDDFKEKVIHLTFQYNPSKSAFLFFDKVQKVLEPTDMSLKIELPERWSGRMVR